MAFFTDYRILTNGIHLQVREYPREGQALLLLHFGGANLMMWQPSVAAFHEHYRLVLVDLRDHGRSDKPQAGDDNETMARDLAGMLEALQLDRIHVLGSSLGAEVGLSLAANFPGRVSSLVCDGALYNEYGPYGTWEGSEQAFRQHVEEVISKHHSRDDLFPTAAAFLEARKTALEKFDLWNPAIEAMWTYDAFQHEDGQFSRSHQWQARQDYTRAYFDSHFETDYRRLQCPVLMVTSDDPDIGERERQATLEMSRVPANGRLVTVPGWEHPYGWLKAPEKMIATVLEFFQECDSAQAGS